MRKGVKDKQFDILGGRRTKSEDYDVVYKNLLMFENLMKFADQFTPLKN
jgi:hypothetical protein